MSDSKQPILVFGATGQQGGSVVASLRAAGWPVRAIIRDKASRQGALLHDAGVELAQGTFNDVDTIRALMTDAHGVFSVQPSSPGGALSDEEETRYGISVADLSAQCGVAHLVYSSGGAVGDKPTGLGHFDSKARIEAHVRTLPVLATIIRPASFMEMLVMPGFGLDEGHFEWFARPDQAMQLLAVDDIGKFVAEIFANPQRFGGQTLEIASDSVTGRDLELAFSEAAGHPISYARFSDEKLAASPFLGKLTALLDAGPLAGHADLDMLRAMNPQMHSLRSWLAGSGRAAFEKALGTTGDWAYKS